MLASNHGSLVEMAVRSQPLDWDNLHISTVSSTLFSSPFNIESSPGLMKVDTVSFSKYLNGYSSE